jgi:L-ribulose-5-phosphate 3-epimerase
VIAVMQGRLSASETGALQEFPRREWEEEFPRAAAAGLTGIEWLYDEYGAGANPLETDSGVARMQELSAAHGVSVGSLCAHWFVQHSVRDEDWPARLEWLLRRCARAEIRRVIVPFLERSEIREEASARGLVQHALSSCEQTEVELLIEATLQPERLAALVEGLEHPLLGINYDSGADDPAGITVLGPWIRGVHLKDRDRSGTNVPLGHGTVDFGTVMSSLASVGYSGNLVLETPRPVRGEEVASAMDAVGFVQQHLP